MPQSTFCHQIHEHCASVGRTVHIVNLDPAADRFDYPVSIDIKALIDVEVCSSPPALRRRAFVVPLGAGLRRLNKSHLCAAERDARDGAGPQRRASLQHGVHGASPGRSGASGCSRHSYRSQSRGANRIPMSPVLRRRRTSTTGCKRSSTHMERMTILYLTALAR